MNFIVWYRQLIWTIYKIKYSKNIQELKTQANFRVWEIWKSLLCRTVAIEKELNIAFIHSSIGINKHVIISTVSGRFGPTINITL
jgi:hypothetical protein